LPLRPVLPLLLLVLPPSVPSSKTSRRKRTTRWDLLLRRLQRVSPTARRAWAELIAASSCASLLHAWYW
jgi:hypothetical protein